VVIRVVSAIACAFIPLIGVMRVVRVIFEVLLVLPLLAL
jgi:hypothetical protein